MHIPNMIRRVLPCIAAVAVLTAISPTAGASSPTDSKATPTSHCVVHVVDQLESGEYILSDEECFDTFSAAMTELGLGPSATTPARAQAAAVTIQATLATHYDGANYTGSSLSIYGVDCLGGWTNMPAAWDNRISSTYSSFCPRIRHYSGAGLSGSSQDTVPSGNLSAPVNNSVSSIQYLL